jgi:hypothetical protein
VLRHAVPVRMGAAGQCVVLKEADRETCNPVPKDYMN